MSTDDWFVIDKSPITGACLWKHVDGTQVAACNEWEEPTDATAWVSGVSILSQRLAAVVFYRRYWHEYQYAD